jgi:hypothetical protein
MTDTEYLSLSEKMAERWRLVPLHHASRTEDLSIFEEMTESIERYISEKRLLESDVESMRLKHSNEIDIMLQYILERKKTAARAYFSPHVTALEELIATGLPRHPGELMTGTSQQKKRAQMRKVVNEVRQILRSSFPQSSEEAESFVESPSADKSDEYASNTAVKKKSLQLLRSCALSSAVCLFATAMGIAAAVSGTCAVILAPPLFWAPIAVASLGVAGSNYIYLKRLLH